MKPKARKDKTSLLFISLLLMLPFVICLKLGSVAAKSG